MTQDDREMLIRMDERVNDIHKVVFGNGKPGLMDEFKEVQINQKHCMEERKQKKVDMKWVVITVIALFEIIVTVKEFV